MPSYKWIVVALWLLALLLAGWILWQLPLPEISQLLAALSIWQWLVWIALNILVILLATQRWLVLARALKLKVTFTQLLLTRQAGQTISFITPGPQFGGEPLQIYWLYKRFGVAIHSAALAVALDRFFELWINFSVLLLGVGFLLLSPSMNMADWQNILQILFLTILLLSFSGWLVLRRPRWLSSRLERVTERWLSSPRLLQLNSHWQAIGTDLQTAFHQQKTTFLRAFIVSVLIWIGIFSELFIVLSFLNIGLDFTGFVLVMVAMRLAMLLPLPGGIGTLEASVLWSFQSLGLSASAALGVIALMRLRDALVLVMGMVCLRALRSAKRNEKK